MILHALHDLYDRLEKDDAYDVAPEGYSLQKISFVIELESDGSLARIKDHRDGDGTQKRPQPHRVLGSAKPSGAGINPCLLWDNTGYLLGYKPRDKDPAKAEKEAARALETFEASRDHHLALEKEIDHPAFSAVCRFLENWNPERLPPVAKLAEKFAARDACLAEAESDRADETAKAEAREKAAELDLEIEKLREVSGEDETKLAAVCAITSGFGVFKLRKSLHFVHEEPAIDAWWRERLEAVDDADATGMCLITGKRDVPITDLHAPKIKGVKDAQGAGALIVSFNTNAYESFGRDSGYNAPVSAEAAGKYCKSLNALLASDKHRLQIGDATTVFWTEKPTALEFSFGALIGGDLPDEDDEDAPEGEPSQASTLLATLQNSLRSVARGGKPEPEIASEQKVPFYILGLTGQAGGRIGVRFWHRTDVGDLVEKLARHHRDLSIVPQWGPDTKHPDPEFPPLWRLLRQTGRESKDIPPNLSGALMRSVLTGAPYPELLSTAVINRIRADRAINYLRAAILKAWLTRIPNANYDIPMTYRPDKPDTAYRLGALFALLEKTQQDALGDVSAGIRDRYYSSASATPASVFPRLLRTYGHHLAKAASGNKGYQVYREREVQDVLAEPDPLGEFPSHLNLRGQGLFAIGYYHKRKDLWTKKDDPESKEPDPEKAN